MLLQLSKLLTSFVLITLFFAFSRFALADWTFNAAIPTCTAGTNSFRVTPSSQPVNSGVVIEIASLQSNISVTYLTATNPVPTPAPFPLTNPSLPYSWTPTQVATYTFAATLKNSTSGNKGACLATLETTPSTLPWLKTEGTGDVHANQ